MRRYIQATVTRKGERAAQGGHPWVFADEITALSGTPQNGELVDVVSEKGKYIGTGWINDRSKIRIRIISTNANDQFDEVFMNVACAMRWTIGKR